MYHFAWTQIHFLIFKVLMFSIWLLLLAADKIKFEHFIYLFSGRNQKIFSIKSVKMKSKFYDEQMFLDKNIFISNY